MAITDNKKPRLAIVVIGRNEGARLVECLRSIHTDGKVVYVDSGSGDGSPEAAKGYVDLVVELDASAPFTAARARNAGAFAACEKWPSVEVLQFVDGDCCLAPDWIETASRFLSAHPDVAIVCGRRRERFPDRSIYNQLCDLEWDTAVGRADACGGDAMVRSAPFREIGGYQPALIAGEEPEMCSRIRARNWSVWRLDAEMTKHDASMLRFSQWWRRAVRSGFAELDILIRCGGVATQERKQVLRALFWGLTYPILVVASCFFLSWYALLALLVYPCQTARIAYARGLFSRRSWAYGLFVMIAKFAGVQGMALYIWRALRARPAELIEYKNA